MLHARKPPKQAIRFAMNLLRIEPMKVLPQL
jgi:hypothetical protein